jgi:hypothetical protein
MRNRPARPRPVRPAPAQVAKAGEQQPSETVASTEPSKPKDRWDKVDILGKLLGSILIPGILAVGTYYFNEALQDRATLQKQVETAVTILESSTSDNLPILKQWALNKVGKALDLPSGALNELQNSPLPGPLPGPQVIEPHPPNPQLIESVLGKLQGEEKKWMTIAISEIGVPNEERIREYAAFISSHDIVIWHSELVNWVMTTAGYTGTNSGSARFWLKWVLFLLALMTKRGGTVGFYLGADKNNNIIILGNFWNQVSTTARSRNLLLGFRWPGNG